MIRELKAYRSICREISEKNIERKNNLVCGAVRGSDSEFPYVQHTITVEGLNATEANNKLLERIQKLEQQKKHTEDFVNQIEDSLTRRIFEYRYIKGDYRPSWTRVAMLIGGGNTADGVRMVHARYLKKLQK